MTPLERRFFVPFEKAKTLSDGVFEHLENRWWVCCPERGILYHNHGHGFTPQCHRDEDMARRLYQKIYPDLEIRFLPSVFHQLNGELEPVL